MRDTGVRAQVLSETLDAVMRHDPLGALPVLEAGGTPWHRALAGYALAIGCRWQEAAARAREARSRARHPTDVWLADAVVAFTAAGIGSSAEVHALEHRLDSLRALPADEQMFVQHLVREAAVGSNALGLAARLTIRFDPGLPTEGMLREHAYLDVVAAANARALAWAGEIEAARAFLARWPRPRTDAGRWLLDAAAGLIGGRAADRSGTLAMAEQVLGSHPAPADYLASGCHLLVAYGLVAVGELERAARHILIGGGGAGLPLAKAIDRALCLDALTALAAEAGDLEAATAWAAQAEPLLAHEVTRSTVQRLQARVALLAGDPAHAVHLAGAAAAADHAAERPLDAAVAELLGAQAEIALAEPGAAQRRLERSVAALEGHGDAAARKAAARELRKAGRRLRPAAGAGWSALTRREREVARLLAQGLTNQQIADQLFLSPHTVRIHVSRVLAAYGVASRAPLPALLAEHLTPAGPLPALTPRQAQVADLVASGLGNHDIAAALGVTVSAVEKHVSAILRAWGLGSRSAIAAAVTRAGQAE